MQAAELAGRKVLAKHKTAVKVRTREGLNKALKAKMSRAARGNSPPAKASGGRLKVSGSAKARAKPNEGKTGLSRKVGREPQRQQGQREQRDQQQGQREQDRRDQQQQGQRERDRDQQQQGQREQGRDQQRGETQGQRDQQQQGQREGQRDQQQGQRDGQQGGQSGTASLTTEQRTHIRETVITRGPKVTNVNFSVRVGTVVPRTVHLVEVPTVLIEVYPQYRGRKYFVYQDEIIIVDDDMRIVAVLTV